MPQLFDLEHDLIRKPLTSDFARVLRIARIGYLAVNWAANPHNQEAFRQGLRDIGYVEGRNIVIEYRYAEGKPERLPALAAELVALKVDVILAGRSIICASAFAINLRPVQLPARPNAARSVRPLTAAKLRRTLPIEILAQAAIQLQIAGLQN